MNSKAMTNNTSKTLRVKAYLKQSINNKLTLTLNMTTEQLGKYCLEKGIQPANIMTIVVRWVKNHE